MTWPINLNVAGSFQSLILPALHVQHVGRYQFHHITALAIRRDHRAIRVSKFLVRQIHRLAASGEQQRARPALQRSGSSALLYSHRVLPEV